LNDNIILYDKNDELISFVEKISSGYEQNFISYDNGGKIIYSKLENEKEYKQNNRKGKDAIPYINDDKKFHMNKNEFITFENLTNKFKITSHLTVYKNKGRIGHIELIKFYDERYLNNISNESNINIYLNKIDKKYGKPMLLTKIGYLNNLINTDENIYVNRYLNSINSDILILFGLSKENLSKQIFENRVLFFSITFFALFIVLIILSFQLKKYLTKPLDVLKEQIKKIQSADYSHTKVIHSNDELELISKNINFLANSVESREIKIKEKRKDQVILLSLFDLGESVLFKWKNDEEWSVDYVSKNVTSLFGYGVDDFIHKKIKYAQCIYKDDLALVTQEVTDASKDDKNYFKHTNYRIITKDNTIKWVMDYTVILRDEEKNITHYLGYVTDITNDIEKDKILFEQSKLASMGEMIGNIAHQWRQPLSVISTGATGLRIEKECGMLTDKDFYEICDSIDKNAQYLSKTIDDFRDFVKGDRKKSIYSLKDNYEHFMSLINSSMKNNNITVIDDIDENIQINGYPDDIIQCFMNIFNNAKDALKEIEIDEKVIFITAKEDKDKLTIEIYDNAGGIDEKILPNIFEPYFTTKHKSQGTGLGLNMTYKLIVEGMDGIIKATNKEFQYKNKKYKGALFTIILLQ